MADCKPNKQMLIVALSIIILCFVLLTGATLALFTSAGPDGTIGVITTSGDLEVGIVDAETGASLVNQTLEFRRDGKGVMALFEPGATYVTQGFKVKNTGESIPINFRLTVSSDEKEDMMEFNRVFDVWISTSSDYSVPPVEISKFYGSLKAGDTTTETYYLFIKMKEEIGNEYQGSTFEGTKYSGIGVTVFATQGNTTIEEAENNG